MTCVDGTINVMRGKDADYTVRLVDCNKKPIDITGWTFVTVRHKKEGGGSLDISTPLQNGTDEVQTLDYGTVPDGGDFKLKIGDDTTAVIPYNASTTDIENAINALPKQAGVTVAGDFTTGHTITFEGGSGKRDQSTIEIVDNNLVTGVNSVTIGVTVNTEGTPMKGVDVTDAKCGVLKVYLSEEDTVLMAKGKSQDIDVCVRVGSRDLNIPPLRKVLTVEASPFE